MASLNKMMADALNELTTAQEHLATASNQAAMARRNETECINRVNKAQKAVDDVLLQIKAQSPRETDWKRAPTVREA